MSVSTAYFDHAATAPVRPEALEELMRHAACANASSVHAAGRRARHIVEDARGRIARILHCEPADIIFTSGGTEADNLAIRGLPVPGEMLAIGRAEHDAVVEAARAEEAAGRPIVWLEPDDRGAVAPSCLQAALDGGARFVSIMAINNETGARADLEGLSQRCRAVGAFLHSDAVQAPSTESADWYADHVDALTLSGHKIGAPQGIGALVVTADRAVRPLLVGGGQERARRSGTEPVALIAAFAKALELAARDQNTERLRLKALRSRLFDGLCAGLGASVRLNGARSGAAAHILNVSFGHGTAALDGEMLLLALDMAGVQASAGSACSSGAVKASRVLREMGVDERWAAATVRFSLGWSTRESDVDAAVTATVEAVRRQLERAGA